MIAAPFVPKISVVIPAKNRAKFIGDCLLSILNQTHLPDEVIVIDDHSTDDTKIIVESFKHLGIRYIFNDRSVGAQGARNCGILAAKSDWIAFQDSDDLWMPNKLELQVQALKNRNYRPDVVVHCSGVKIDEAQSKVSKLVTSQFEGGCYKKLLLSAGPMFQGMLVSKEALLNINLLDEKCISFQEWDTSIRLSSKNFFIHLKTPLFKWICHQDETISKDFRRDIEGHRYILNKYKDEILNNYGYSGWSIAISDLFCKSIKYKFFDDAAKLYPQITNIAKPLAYLMIRYKKCPRGASHLLRLINKLFG